VKILVINKATNSIYAQYDIAEGIWPDFTAPLSGNVGEVVPMAIKQKQSLNNDPKQTMKVEPKNPWDD
jgi:hypothetical protein